LVQCALVDVSALSYSCCQYMSVYSHAIWWLGDDHCAASHAPVGKYGSLIQQNMF